MTQATAPVNFDDLDSGLDGLIASVDLQDERQDPTYEQRCPKCSGSGQFVSYSGRVVGACFHCKGKGVLTFRTSPEARAKGRAAAATRKARAAADNWADFAVAHAEIADWIIDAKDSFDFAASLEMSVRKYGPLSEKQLAAAQKCVDSRKAKAAAAMARVAAAPSVDVTPLVESFDRALANGLKKPKLRLPGYTFSLAPAGGRNAGAIYVKAGETYLGKLADGRFVAGRDCTAEQSAEVVALAGDPAAAAVAYGRRTGRCAICGAELTNHASIERGIGPICAEKFGF